MTNRSHTDPLFKTCKILKISDVNNSLFFSGMTMKQINSPCHSNIYLDISTIYTDTCIQGEDQISILIYQEINLSKISYIYYSKAGEQKDGNIGLA